MFNAWTMFLGALILAIVSSVVRIYVRAKRYRSVALGINRSNKGLCPACGYDVCATPDRCPECGAMIRKDKWLPPQPKQQ